MRVARHCVQCTGGFKRYGIAEEGARLPKTKQGGDFLSGKMPGPGVAHVCGRGGGAPVGCQQVRQAAALARRRLVGPRSSAARCRPAHRGRRGWTRRARRAPQRQPSRLRRERQLRRHRRWAIGPGNAGLSREGRWPCAPRSAGGCPRPPPAAPAFRRPATQRLTSRAASGANIHTPRPIIDSGFLLPARGAAGTACNCTVASGGRL